MWFNTCSDLLGPMPIGKFRSYFCSFIFKYDISKNNQSRLDLAILNKRISNNLIRARFHIWQILSAANQCKSSISRNSKLLIAYKIMVYKFSITRYNAKEKLVISVSMKQGNLDKKFYKLHLEIQIHSNRLHFQFSLFQNLRYNEHQTLISLPRSTSLQPAKHRNSIRNSNTSKIFFVKIQALTYHIKI